MEIKNRKIDSLWIIMGGSILMCVVVALMYLFDCSFKIIDAFSIVGAIASIIGIAITMKQVSSVQKEVVKNNEAIRMSHNIVDFNGESNRVRQIRDALPTKEYKYIMWQISELKVFLVKQKSNPIIKEKKGMCDTFDDIVVKLSMDVKNLTNKITSQKYSLDKEIISEHLDEVETLLAEINGELQSNSYDPR